MDYSTQKTTSGRDLELKAITAVKPSHTSCVYEVSLRRRVMTYSVDHEFYIRQYAMNWDRDVFAAKFSSYA